MYLVLLQVNIVAQKRDRLRRQFMLIGHITWSTLRWIMSFKEPPDQLPRWLEALSQFDFANQHPAGKKHGNVDRPPGILCDLDGCDSYDGQVKSCDTGSSPVAGEACGDLFLGLQHWRHMYFSWLPWPRNQGPGRGNLRQPTLSLFDNSTGDITAEIATKWTLCFWKFDRDTDCWGKMDSHISEKLTLNTGPSLPGPCNWWRRLIDFDWDVKEPLHEDHVYPWHWQSPVSPYLTKEPTTMGFAVRVRSAGQKYGPACHQRDRADVTEFVTLVWLSSLGQHVGVLALAGYKRRKSALTAGPNRVLDLTLYTPCTSRASWRGGYGLRLYGSRGPGYGSRLPWGGAVSWARNFVCMWTLSTQEWMGTWLDSNCLCVWIQ